MPGEQLPYQSAESAQTPIEELKKRENVDRIFNEGLVTSATTVEFGVEDHDGVELSPGHSFAFVIPENMRGRLVRDVILKHRKAEKYRVEGSESYDPNGAYSRVELHDQNTGQWLSWLDPEGYNPDKYAEWRSAQDPEVENLHDWIATVGEIKPDIALVTNVGQHPEYSTSNIHALEVVFFPELGDVTYDEHIFTPGTKFVDIEHGKTLPEYGGGERTHGVYKNSVVLGRANPKFEVCQDPGEDVEVSGSTMSIKLPGGKDLVQIEVAAGDTENGTKPRLGWAKLWVGIQREGSNKVDWFVQNANVPPQGVISGGPALEHSAIKDGDRLVIKSAQDTTYVMGYRLAYKEDKPEQDDSDNGPKRQHVGNLTAELLSHLRAA